MVGTTHINEFDTEFDADSVESDFHDNVCDIVEDAIDIYKDDGENMMTQYLNRLYATGDVTDESLAQKDMVERIIAVVLPRIDTHVCVECLSSASAPPHLPLTRSHRNVYGTITATLDCSCCNQISEDVDIVF